MRRLALAFVLAELLGCAPHIAVKPTEARPAAITNLSEVKRKVRRRPVIQYVDEATATVYYLRSDGHNGASGLANTADATTGAWQTLAQANAHLQPGDRLQVISMTAADTTSGVINPANASTALNAAHIAYVGVMPATAYSLPTAASLANFGLASLSTGLSNVTIKGFRFRGGISLNYGSETARARNDSIAYCVIGDAAKTTALNNKNNANAVTFQGAKDNVIAHNRIGGACRVFGNGGGTYPITWTANSERDTLRGNAWGGAIYSDDPNLVGDRNVMFRAFYMHQFVIDSNQVTGTAEYLSVNPDEIQLVKLHRCYANHFKDNTWTLNVSRAVQDTHKGEIFRVRDSSGTDFNNCSGCEGGNTFTRDTLLGGLDSTLRAVDVYISCAGNVGTEGDEIGNVWDSCVFKLLRGTVYAQDAFRSTLRYCSIITGSNDTYMPTGGGGNPALFIPNCQSGVIYHNTIVANHAPFHTGDDNRRGLTNADVRGNIFISRNATSSTGCTSYQSTDQTLATPHPTSDYNLFYSYDAGSLTPQDYAVIYAGGNHSRVGTAQPTGTAPWTITPHFEDRNSRFGDPVLSDTSVASFNPRVQRYGLADGSQWASVGGYVGAISPVDTIPPDSTYTIAIGDCVAETVVPCYSPGGSAGQTYDREVSFVMPGDDGNIGTAYTWDYVVDLGGHTLDRNGWFWGDNGPGSCESGIPCGPPGTLTTFRFGAEGSPMFSVNVRVRDAAGNVSYGTTVTAPTGIGFNGCP